MFDPSSAKRDMLQQILELAREASANDLKARHTPAPPDEAAVDGLDPGSAEAGIGDEPGAQLPMEGGGEGEPSPEALEQLLALLGGNEEEELPPGGLPEGA